MTFYKFYIAPSSQNITASSAEMKEVLRSYIGNSLFFAKQDMNATWLITTFSKSSAAKLVVAFGVLPESISALSFFGIKIYTILERIAIILGYVLFVFLAIVMIIALSD